MPVDYVIVGSGLFGTVFAREAAEAGKKVLLVDRRPHIAGNCYSENVNGIDVHRYGPHIFHTDNRKVWDYVCRFTEMNHFRYRSIVRKEDNLYSFPINLMTLHQLWGVRTPLEARQKLDEVRIPHEKPSNLEEWILSEVGQEIYEIFVKGYTTKQWGCDPKELPASIIRRIPIRLTWNDRYFDDRFEGIPVNGYTAWFENMLDHELIEVQTGVDYYSNRKELDNAGNKLVFTGKIDEYFDYRFGALEYRSLRFETETFEGDYQGNAIINEGSVHVPYTRTVEHKHFMFKDTSNTIITREYPDKYEVGKEAFYPIRNEKNTAIYEKYNTLAKLNTPNVIFGGRLGSYRYYDMHQVIAESLHTAKVELSQHKDSRLAA